MIALELLVDWSLGALVPSEVDRVEEHLFDCDECSRTARRLLELREATRDLVLGGHVRLVLTGALLRRLEEEGLEIRRYDLAPGQSVPCRASAQQIYALTRLEADLRDVERVALRMIDQDGTELSRHSDVPFDSREGAILLVEPGDSVRAWPVMKMQIQATGYAKSGERRTLGHYYLDHQGCE